MRYDDFNIHRLFTNLYRYPFKLVIRPRPSFFLSRKKNEYRDTRHSPPGFNPEDSSIGSNTKIENPIIKYDLYLEPDSIKSMSCFILLSLTLIILVTSYYLTDNNNCLTDNNNCLTDNNCFYCIKNNILPSFVFFVSYVVMMYFIQYHYRGYPLFIKNWSKKTNCYAGWFYQVPQAILLSEKDKNRNKHFISKITNEIETIHKRESQALYYAWNTGSSQKSMWLLSIEETINKWETEGIFKKNTSLIVLLAPIWISYLSLLILLIYSDAFDLNVLKKLYVPIVVWILVSFFYLLVIYMFISERNNDDKITGTQINKFLPYELRSTNKRHPEIYKRFKEESFITLVNFLFVALLIFYVTVLSLVK